MPEGHSRPDSGPGQQSDFLSLFVIRAGVEKSISR